MTIDAALMSSARTGTGNDSWTTPVEVLELVRKVGPIHLDPCWNDRALTDPVVKYSEADDGLAHPWDVPRGSLAFVNPPYSDIRTWLDRCYSDWVNGRNECTIALVPARTDTRAWHECFPTAICFWRGRLRFGGAKNSAPFPSALLCWALGDMRDRFCSVFADAGMVVKL